MPYRLRARALLSLASLAFFAPAACGGSSGATGPGGDGGPVDATAPVDGTLPPDDSGPLDGGAPALDANEDAGPVVAAPVTVDPTKPLGTVGPAFVGLSYEKAHLEDGFFRGDNAPLIALFQLLGPSILRVGGNSVDESVWQTFDAGPPVGDAAAPTVITTADIDGLAAFVKAAGWKVIYGVNLKTSSPEAAEAEAAYAAAQLGDALFGFEIGNEPDLYKSVVSAPGTWTYDTFKSDWETFAAAIHDDAGAPGSPLTGPASASNYKTWTLPFATDEQKAITLLTQHYYVANGQSDASTIALLLAPDPALDTELAALSTAATDAGIANAYRLSECNSFYNGGAPGVSDGYGTALWAIDFLFTNARYGSTGTNFHGGGDGPGYTPIADDGTTVVGARPEFYGMLLFAKAGTGTLYTTTGSLASPNFSAYAIGASGAAASVVLSNKDSVTTVRATVDVGTAITSAQVTRLTGPSLSATTGVQLGGASIQADGGFTPNAPEALSTSGSTFTIDVGPASAALVSVH
jgi:hypothetical protein